MRHCVCMILARAHVLCVCVRVHACVCMFCVCLCVYQSHSVTLASYLYYFAVDLYSKCVYACVCLRVRLELCAQELAWLSLCLLLSVVFLSLRVFVHVYVCVFIDVAFITS
jgi:hypothetical protein